MSLGYESADRSSGTLSFEELYERYATDVLRVSYYYLGNREMAEDVTQDVFVKLITNAPSLEEGREKAWLLKVALNRCRDIWRSAWMRRATCCAADSGDCRAGDDRYAQSCAYCC